MIKALRGLLAPVQSMVSMQVRTKNEWGSHFVYRKRMKSKYKGNPYPRLQMILIKDVEDLGVAGDVVKVKRGCGRWDLIPNKLAVYAIKENLIKYGINPKALKDGAGSKVPTETIKYLKKQELHLTIPDMANAHEEYKDTWIITRHDIAEYFYRHEMLVVPLHCIKLLGCEDNIIREVGSFTAEITVN